MKYWREYILISLIIATLAIICSDSEREIEFTYTGTFHLVEKIDFGDPLFYNVDKYYLYGNTGLEENAKFDPIATYPHFLGVWEHDSLGSPENGLVEVEFVSNTQITEAIMFASGSNRFNNTRFSAGDMVIVRIKK